MSQAKAKQPSRQERKRRDREFVEKFEGFEATAKGSGNSLHA
jgi:hypothetical protein